MCEWLMIVSFTTLPALYGWRKVWNETDASQRWQALVRLWSQAAVVVCSLTCIAGLVVALFAGDAMCGLIRRNLHVISATMIVGINLLSSVLGVISREDRL